MGTTVNAAGPLEAQVMQGAVACSSCGLTMEQSRALLLMSQGLRLVPKEVVDVLQMILDDSEDGRGYTNLDDELADRARAALALVHNS